MVAPSSLKPTALEPSQLGTKEYWDGAYSRELENLKFDPTDTGTIWFSDSLAQEKVVDFLQTQVFGRAAAHPSILDLGTGNGEMLFALVEEDIGGKLMGVDYSAHSVELARRVAAEKDVDSKVTFNAWDVLTGCGEDGTEQDMGRWDVVLDKGTFDAVSLSGIPGVEEQYVRNTKALLNDGGFLLVTSCNWTEEELKRWFLGNGDLESYGRVIYPTFTFGGATGQSISTICFRKNL